MAYEVQKLPMYAFSLKNIQYLVEVCEMVCNQKLIRMLYLQTAVLLKNANLHFDTAMLETLLLTLIFTPSHLPSSETRLSLQAISKVNTEINAFF